MDANLCRIGWFYTPPPWKTSCPSNKVFRISSIEVKQTCFFFSGSSENFQCLSIWVVKWRIFGKPWKGSAGYFCPIVKMLFTCRRGCQLTLSRAWLTARLQRVHTDLWIAISNLTHKLVHIKRYIYLDSNDRGMNKAVYWLTFSSVSGTRIRDDNPPITGCRVTR